MKKITIPIFQVDAFTNKAFSGNPAAVCLLDAEKDKAWMQSVAMEMNLSETAFIRRIDRGFELRWFTPTHEVDLCGHATLAAAHVLWEQGWLSLDEVAQFYTLSGLLCATKKEQGIMLDFPATPVECVVTPPGLLEALGCPDSAVYFNQFDYMVLLNDENKLRDLQPDFTNLATIKARGFIVTAALQNKQYDFISRFFAPAYGIDEDPVTGSAHCALTPFWAERLGKTKMQAFQASPRGGEIGLTLFDDRVLLSGEAITVFGGQLYV